MTWFKHWLRTTFDYNPSFPLSALLLLGGLRTLSLDGNLDAASIGDTALGVGILQAYELGLLGVALLLLWPRRIAYETTSILTIVAVVRFASPFLAAGMAAEGLLTEALAFGAGLGLLMACKGEAVVRGAGLDLKRWERHYDYALYLLAAVGFPLLGNRLAAWTGADLSHAQARLLHVGTWWTFALLLVPSALGLRGLGPDAPLRSRRPAIVWRCLTLAGLSLLLYNALWVGGDKPPVFAYLPLLLVVGALYAAVARAHDREPALPVVHLPALLAAAVVLLPQGLLLGLSPVCSRSVAVLAFLPLALVSLPLIQPRATRPGLRSVAWVAVLAPLKLAPTWHAAELYLLGLALALLVVGVVQRRDRLVVISAAFATLLAAHLGWRHGLATPTQLALAAGGVVALLAALRELDGPYAARLARGLYLGGVAWEAVHHVPGAASVGVGLASAGALGVLAWRRRERATGWTAGVGAAALLGRRLSPALDPGISLVLLAFAAIPVGTVIALRRERLREQEQEQVFEVDALPDPAGPSRPALEVA